MVAPALLALPTLARPPWLRRPVICGVVGSSMFIEVFMLFITARRISSYPGSMPVFPIGPMPREVEVPLLMRLRIISVAALNWGTYFGGESVIGALAELEGAGVLGLGG